MRQRRAARRPPSSARRRGRHGLTAIFASGLLALLLALAACAPGAVSTTHPSGQGTAAPHALTYIAIGASDAFGIGTDDPDRQAWPTLVARRLGPGTHLINLAVPGATTALALQNELPVALDAHPDVVTVWLAVNDFADGVPLADYRAQLGTLLRGLRRGLPDARIVVGNMPDLTVLPHFFGEDPAKLRGHVQAWNAAIATDCTAAGVTLVDLYAEWSELADHPEYISGDGFHPSAIGAERLADLFSVALDLAAVSSPTPGGTP
jgi:acyl-CoA thioesterase I